MRRPRLLDLFCNAGGAAMGYHRAGFEVVGVDIEDQPDYPFEFHQADALEFPFDGFDAIHASPPCQSFTAYRRRGAGVGDGYPDLIAPMRERLEQAGVPWVIENVAGAPLRNAVMLCGSSFGLDVRRHRYFESNVMLMAPPCDHTWQTPRFPAATNRTNLRRTVEVGVWRIPLDVQQRAMGIDWMPLRNLTEAIPPAYTEHLGRQLLAAIGCNVASRAYHVDMTAHMIPVQDMRVTYVTGTPPNQYRHRTPLMAAEIGEPNQDGQHQLSFIDFSGYRWVVNGTSYNSKRGVWKHTVERRTSDGWVPVWKFDLMNVPIDDDNRSIEGWKTLVEGLRETIKEFGDRNVINAAHQLGLFD